VASLNIASGLPSSAARRSACSASARGIRSGLSRWRFEGIVVVEQQKHRLGVVLRDRRTQQGNEFVSVGHGARQRDLDVRVIAVLGVGLLAGLQPELAVLVGDVAIAPVYLGRAETQAIVDDGRGRRLRSSRVGRATAKQKQYRK
jgi:hypothetical protein